MNVSRLPLVWSIGAWVLLPWQLSAEGSVEPLGQSPLCEASALQRLGGESSRWLVADNEVRDRLFMFDQVEGRLRPSDPDGSPSLGIEKGPRDIEALAIVAGDLYIVGSHSRGKNCAAAAKKKRRRIVRVRLGEERLEFVARVSGRDAIDALQRSAATMEDCLAALFVRPPPDRSLEVCNALLVAEREATPKRCETFNIEGAVGISGADGSERLWLGLRSPLVGGKAVLLRLAPESRSLRFDAVSLIDLSGLGVRALARSGEQLVAVAGDTLDSQRFELWVGALPTLGARHPAFQFLRSLPAGSEGIDLEPSGAHAFVVIDGEESGPDSAQCRRAAGQFRTSLRPARTSAKPPTKSPK